MSKVKKFFRTALAVILTVVLLYLGITIWMNRDNLPFVSNKKEDDKIIVSSEMIEAEVLSISEYATLAYQYTNVSEFRDIREFYGMKLPFTNKSFLIKYDGEMKFGIDGSKAKVEISSDTISIKLPQAEILTHAISEDSIGVFDQTHNIFNQIEIEDYAEFAIEQKKIMEQRAYNEGVFDNARESAEQQISGFVKNIPGVQNEYNVVIFSDSDQVALDEKNKTLKKQAINRLLFYFYSVVQCWLQVY